MQQFVGTSLKKRLYLLVLAAFIPIAFLIFYITEEQKAVEEGVILQKAMVLAKAMANEENQQLESTTNLLSVLADLFLMIQGEAERLSGVLDNLRKQSNGYKAFGFLDTDGRLLVGSHAAGLDKNYRNKVWFSDALKHEQLAMGPYHGEHIHDKPVIYFALPVRDNSCHALAVVFAAMDLDWVNRNIFKQLAELPKGSRLTLLDEARGMLSYDVDDGQWSMADQISPDLRHKIFGRPSGILVASDENGDAWIYAFALLDSPITNRPVSIVLEVPKAIALAAPKRIFIRNVVLLVISVSIALLSIWWAANAFIIRRIRAMVRASREIAAGDFSVRIGKLGVQDELSHLAGVFDEMAASLQRRTARESEVMASLERSRKQLRNLAAYQQEVREKERIRIAREIHDQFGQSLTILKMDLTLIKKHLPEFSPVVVEKMASMAQVIDEAMKGLHTVTAELRPVILDDFGLAAAIEWQIDEFRERTGIDCRVSQCDAAPDLPMDQATALFRIFQEILTNIIRHAQADEVMVRLEARDDELILQVQDNGRGITEDEINDSASYGLLGIRERLYPWNGTAVFEGRPGQGTRVTARLPYFPKGEGQ